MPVLLDSMQAAVIVRLSLSGALLPVCPFSILHYFWIIGSGTMRRIFSGVIGERGIEPGRAVLGGVAALSESTMLNSTSQLLRYGSEIQAR